MANFAGLNSALSALVAHRHASEVIANNISNVNSPNFSRRRAELVADGPAPAPQVYSKGNGLGNGVHVESVTRVRDYFLETQYRNESGLNSQLGSLSTVMARIETAFPEPSDTGIANQMEKYWDAWSTVANSPGSESARQAVLQQGNVLTDAIRQADRQLRVVHEDASENVHTIVDQVNAITKRLSVIEQGIKSATSYGLTPNDLLDERDGMVNQLTQLIGVTAIESKDGSMGVYLGGRALVHDGIAEPLKAEKVADPALGPMGFDRMEIQWEIDGSKAGVTSGEMQGFLQGVNTEVPRYLGQLDAVAKQLVTDVNALHSTGKDLDGVTGANFFDPAGVTAATIGLSADVRNQPRKVVAAAPDPALPAAPTGPLDTTIATKIGELRRAATGPNEAYQGLITGLGTDVNFINNQSDVQNGLVQRLDADRQAVSGVNLDEEMVNLVATQHAYDAAAKVISTIDEMLDTLINRTGLG